MFDKTARMVYSNVGTQDLSHQIAQYWISQGFFVSHQAQNYVGGEAYTEEMGIKTQFAANIYPDGEKTYVDLRLTGNLSTNGIIILVICCLFSLLLAAILGYIAYDKYEKRANYLTGYFWDTLNRATGKMGMPAYAYYGPAPPAPPPPQ